MLFKTDVQNAPYFHGTLGVLAPIDIAPANPTLWTIHNTTDCELSLSFWISIEINGTDVEVSFPVNLNGHSNYTLDYDLIHNRIKHYYDFTSYKITKSSAQLSYGLSEFNQQTYPIGELYPGQSTISTSNSNVPPPCDCLYINFDRNTKTITISYGVC